jgi:hypothetical protein
MRIRARTFDVSCPSPRPIPEFHRPSDDSKLETPTTALRIAEAIGRPADSRSNGKRRPGAPCARGLTVRSRGRRPAEGICWLLCKHETACRGTNQIWRSGIANNGVYRTSFESVGRPTLEPDRKLSWAISAGCVSVGFAKIRWRPRCPGRNRPRAVSARRPTPASDLTDPEWSLVMHLQA